MAALERRYAKALMDALKSKDEKIEMNNKLGEIAELFNSNMQFKKILLDPRINSKAKVGVIKELFTDTGSMLISFLSLLIDKNRISCLSGISNEYSLLTRELNNELFINIISASKLSDDEINGISDKYKKLYNVSAVKYSLKVDEDLLGGVKVIVGNKIYDGSLKTKLRNML